MIFKNSLPRFAKWFCLIWACIYLWSCATPFPYRPGYSRLTGRVTVQGIEVGEGWQRTGNISYYGKEFKGKKTASGEIFDPNALTAAHPSLPFNSRLKVTLLSSGKSVEVRVNDRGPFKGRRILDVSFAAAQELGLIQQGIGKALLELVE